VEIDRWVPIFGDPPRGDMSQQYEALAKALTKVVYEKVSVPAETFLDIIPALPGYLRTIVSNCMSKDALDFLFGTTSWPWEGSREPFMRHAEVLVDLVQLQLYEFNGAVAVISCHIEKPEYRCAAVTMIRMMVEKSNHLIQAASPAVQAKLRRIVVELEPAFQRDKDYILSFIDPEPLDHERQQEQQLEQHMEEQERHLETQLLDNLQPAQDHPAEAASVGMPDAQVHGTLAFSHAMTGHTSTIFAMCIDSLSNNLYTSGKDGQLIAWNVDGKIKETYRVAANRYAFSHAMDVDSQNRVLLSCVLGQPSGPGGMKEQNVFHHRLQRDPQAMSCSTWAFSDCLSWRDRQRPAMLSAIKVLPHAGSHCFIMGECLQQSPGVPSYVAVYDMSISSFSDLTPVSLHDGHTKFITCLSAVPGQPSAFLSGAQDSTIRLWDRRAASQCSVFGGDVSHQASVMGLDANSSNTVLSTGQDKSVARWDMRSLHSPVSKIQLDDSVHSKVACAGNRAYAGVTTLRGLYCLDLSTPQLSLGEVQMKPMNSRYGEIKWSEYCCSFFVASNDSTIHAFKLI